MRLGEAAVEGLVLARLGILKLQGEVEPQGFFYVNIEDGEVLQWTVQTLYGPAGYSAIFRKVPGGVRVLEWLGQESTFPPPGAKVIDLGTTCRPEQYVEPEFCAVLAGSDPSVIATARSENVSSAKRFDRKVGSPYKQWLPIVQRNAN